MFSTDPKSNDGELQYSAALKKVSTHRHVVSIDVVIFCISMDYREFHPRRVV